MTANTSVLSTARDNLLRVVQDLDTNASLQFRPLPVVIDILSALRSLPLQGSDYDLYQRDIVDLLVELNGKIRSHKYLDKYEVQQISRTILHLKKEYLKHKIDLVFAYISTSDYRDQDGAFLSTIDYLIDDEIAFVATRSFLSGADESFTHDKSSKIYTTPQGYTRDPYLIDEKTWEVYAYSKDQNSGELVICIPKKYFKGDVSPDRLSQLDLKADGTLRQITVREAFSGPVGTSSYHEFSDMFSDSPTKTKFFILDGHGKVNTPVGMRLKDYKQFLRDCRTQKCGGLLISSCYSGGVSSLIPIELSAKEKKSLSFPIITESLGDWSTTGVSMYETVGRISKIKTMFEDPSSLTRKKLRKFLYDLNMDSLNKAKAGSTQKIENRFTITFPHSYESPSGSRAAEEVVVNQTITVADLRGVELLASPLRPPNRTAASSADNTGETTAGARGKQPKIINVAGTAHLLLHPTVIHALIQHSMHNPIYISMTPGNAQHFITHVKLAPAHAWGPPVQTPLEWLKRFEPDYKHIGVNKGFFIGRVDSPSQAASSSSIKTDDALEDVVMICSPDGMRAVYKKEGAYFMYYKDSEVSISPFRYATVSLEISQLTAPTQLSTKAATAGQQDHLSFLKAVTKKGFWSDAYPDLDNFDALPQSKLEKIFNKLEDPNDKINFIFLLLSSDIEFKNPLIIHLLEMGKFSPNIVNFDDIPLLSVAIKNNNPFLVEYLLNKGADINQTYTEAFLVALTSKSMTKTPFLEAVRSDNRELMKLILKYRPLEDAMLLGNALRHIKDNVKMARLLTKSSKIALSADFWEKFPSLLIFHVEENHLEMTKLFLKLGAPLNVKGGPSLLYYSIWHKNLEMVQLLLDHHADPFEKDSADIVPFIYCVSYGTPEIVSVILDNVPAGALPQPMLSLAMLNAVSRGDDTIINMLIQRGGVIDSGVASSLVLEKIIQKFKEIHDDDYVRTISTLLPVGLSWLIPSPTTQHANPKADSDTDDY